MNLPVTIAAASVTWMTLEPVGEGAPNALAAALLHGTDAQVGALRSSAGQTAIARLGDAWHVLHSESCTVVVPAAAGLMAWRVTLAGKVLRAGEVDADGTLALIHLDDRGHTDRYVLGDRDVAEAVAEPVRHYQLSTLAAITEMCASALPKARFGSIAVEAVLASAPLPMESDCPKPRNGPPDNQSALTVAGADNVAVEKRRTF